ncbi:hypothetical protein LR48_Vigan04g094400 [Vigna angularis]|uniref:Putative plant transposon protein domain-containing protein n=1 Tax=Phaseolus angularis TaxID=3914 RepID=A0A0L9UDF0_PHAAN|nr:hypothetical protein LR48_Vigan04g094400 [Vigna angularis]
MTSSSRKRIKTVGNKRKEPELPYSNKFLSRRHEHHFLTIQDRRLLMERKAGWIPGLAPQYGGELKSRKWERIAMYPTPANIAMVKEFYTNARPLGFYTLTGLVGIGMVQPCIYRRADLTPMAKYWMAFSHANIQPCSHVSDITVSRAIFLYCVLRGMSNNIGQVIASEIQTCANTMNNKAPLGHPSLITHLCELAGVNTSSPPLERPRKAIDEAYYTQYCGGDEGQVATAEIIIEMYDTPPRRRWTMDEFNNVVASTEEQAQGSGGGAAEAPAMEEDDEDDDDFEDAEEG